VFIQFIVEVYQNQIKYHGDVVVAIDVKDRDCAYNIIVLYMY